MNWEPFGFREAVAQVFVVREMSCRDGGVFCWLRRRGRRVSS